ncbi:acyl-CoA thioesterase [Chloroflexota bacterium]|nr:acyl-CoA thioesterase [Chloroflexota bacterium]
MEEKTLPYYHPITVRYADLDPQGHVNNAAYMTYLEAARLGYYERAGIWSPESGDHTGMVVAHAEIDFLAPIAYGQPLRVGVRLEKMGTKSMVFDFLVEAADGSRAFARGQSVMVAYDNATESSRPIPPEWREKLSEFEGNTKND